MCERLGELRAAMATITAGFDPALVSVRDAAQVVHDAARIEKLAATLKLLAGARVADTEYWAVRGERSPAHALAKESGSSVGQAAEAIDAGRRLLKPSRTADAARRGELSPAQASAITKATAANPAAEKRLLELADGASLAELKDECSRVEAAATDSEERHRKIKRERRLRSFTDGEGAGNIAARGTVDDVARMMAVVEAERDRLFAQARREGRRESPEAYAFDALFNLLCGTASESAVGRSRPKVIVRVDLGALLRGYPIEGEVSEVCGYGPVPCSAIVDMLATADPFLAAVVTDGVAVCGVAHLSRRPRAHQQTALEWLYPTCAVKGCSAPVRLQNDHRVDWADTHFTLLELLDRLCPFHHRLKTFEGWGLVHGSGKRDFVPPHDPRHPKNAHAPPATAA